MTKEDFEKFLKDNSFFENVIYSLNKKLDINYLNNSIYHNYEVFDKISFKIEKNRFSNCYMITIFLINDNSFNKESSEVKEELTEKLFFFGNDFDNETTDFSEDIINNIKIPTSGVILSIKDFNKAINFLNIKGIDFDILDKNLKTDVQCLEALEHSLKRIEKGLKETKEEIIEMTERIKKEGDFLAKYDNRKKRIHNK